MTEGTYIIVIDDEPEVQRMVKRVLEMEGYAVSVVGSSREALDLLGMLTPDLVILNIAMSDHDSLQVLDLIRVSTGVPVIMITANSEVNSMQKVQSLGVDDYVSKPFRMGELLARVRKQLNDGPDSVSGTQGEGKQ